MFVGNYWKSTENQRKFFIEFASQKGFDPLELKNWDKIKALDFRKEVIIKCVIMGYGCIMFITV